MVNDASEDGCYCDDAELTDILHKLTAVSKPLSKMTQPVVTSAARAAKRGQATEPSRAVHSNGSPSETFCPPSAAPSTGKASSVAASKHAALAPDIVKQMPVRTSQGPVVTALDGGISISEPKPCAATPPTNSEALWSCVQESSCWSLAQLWGGSRLKPEETPWTESSRARGRIQAGKSSQQGDTSPSARPSMEGGTADLHTSSSKAFATERTEGIVDCQVGSASSTPTKDPSANTDLRRETSEASKTLHVHLGSQQGESSPSTLVDATIERERTRAPIAAEPAGSDISGQAKTSARTATAMPSEEEQGNIDEALLPSVQQLATVDAPPLDVASWGASAVEQQLDNKEGLGDDIYVEQAAVEKQEDVLQELEMKSGDITKEAQDTPEREEEMQESEGMQDLFLNTCQSCGETWLLPVDLGEEFMCKEAGKPCGTEASQTAASTFAFGDTDAPE
eukprot:CAMPEP_0115560552 /NCGR_PEP_ID=MMETSP0271-20121206/100532_1 /TAXON_ID=71861 /ORGANISM="Scrippsiella trochoidea, Strain CCMP3099" /LENGTH=452 /DNA_ID=CAMNT_0002994641 /DNA_START=72 /DNA_END=1430 /DNA_ORIENTATION=+